MTARLLQIIVGIAGLCALVLGLFIWANIDLTDIHMLFGLLVTLGLLVMSIIVLTAPGLRIWGLVGIVYAIILLIFGEAQSNLLVGNLRLYDPVAAHADRHRRYRADGLFRRALQDAEARRGEARRFISSAALRREEMRISREGHLVTVINVFETKPEQQQELIDQWMRLAEEVKKEPGFIGAALHRSADGTRVINYAQWRSEAAYSSFVKKYSKQFATHLQFASGVDPHLYDVVYLSEWTGS